MILGSWLIVLLLCIPFNVLAQAKIDSVTVKADSLIMNNEARLDSIHRKADRTLNKIQNVDEKINLGDSIDPGIARYNQKLDSLKRKLVFRMDSLDRVGQPTEKYKYILDSLNRLISVKQIDNTNERITNLQNKMTELLNKASDGINGKLALMNKEGGGETGIPGSVNISGVSQVNLNGLNLPGTPMPDVINGSLPDPLGKMGLPSTVMGDMEINDPLTDMGGLPDQKLGKMGELAELDRAKGSVGKISEVSEQLKGVGDEIRDIRDGGLGSIELAPKSVEEQLTKTEQVQEIQKEMSGVEEMKELAEKGNDPEALKEMAKMEVAEKAIDHFAGKGEQLQNAMQRISTAKQKYSSIKSIKELQKRPPNPMKGKPLIERIVPGLVLQIQNSGHWLIDFNPVAGYQLGGKVNAGLGWNYRLSLGKHFKTFTEEYIHGPRVFSEFKFGNGFALRVDIERMNTVVPPLGFNGITSEGTRQWVWSAFGGMKKEYKFFKNIQGNFQFLYNFYDDHDNSPYADRLVVRTGFEFPQKRKGGKDKNKPK